MSAFFITGKVRFGDVDAAGIAYFPRIHEYLHDAFEELWERHVGIRYADLILARRIGFPVVRSEVDFRHPLRFGDRPEVRITCFRLGRSSLGLRYLIRLDRAACVDARMITACVDIDTMHSIPIPEEFRVRLEAIREAIEASPAEGRTA
jgi:YbgC/YbaW family acyl-CoA thioester hydrolase